MFFSLCDRHKLWDGVLKLNVVLTFNNNVCTTVLLQEPKRCYQHGRRHRCMLMTSLWMMMLKSTLYINQWVGQRVDIFHYKLKFALDYFVHHSLEQEGVQI